VAKDEKFEGNHNLPWVMMMTYFHKILYLHEKRMKAYAPNNISTLSMELFLIVSLKTLLLGISFYMATRKNKRVHR
jgi:hypothetical protein